MGTLLEYQISQTARATGDTVGAGAPLLAATVNLYQAQIDFNMDTPLATFTAAVATFDGYAAKTITWQAVSVADDGTVECVGTISAFRPTGSVTSNVIWGCYITNSAGDTLLAAAEFDNPPIPMDGALDTINITIRFRPASQTIGVVVS